MSDFYVSGKKILPPEDIYMTNQEIADLKKQILGVIRNSLSHLFSSRKVVLV